MEDESPSLIAPAPPYLSCESKQHFLICQVVGYLISQYICQYQVLVVSLELRLQVAVDNWVALLLSCDDGRFGVELLILTDSNLLSNRKSP